MREEFSSLLESFSLRPHRVGPQSDRGEKAEARHAAGNEQPASASLSPA